MIGPAGGSAISRGGVKQRGDGCLKVRSTSSRRSHGSCRPLRSSTSPRIPRSPAAALPPCSCKRKSARSSSRALKTDVCVLSSVLSAVDHGFRVIVAEDGLCSSSDAGHDALMTLYRTRFTEQIELMTIEEVCALWRDEA